MALRRRRHRLLAGGVLGAALLGGACTHFQPSDGPPGAGDAGPDVVAVDAGVGAPVFLGSGTTPPSAPPVQVSSPPGVQPGDLLLAAWLAGSSTSALPPSWVEVRRLAVTNSYGDARPLIVGYHPVGPTESDATNYPFSTAGGSDTIEVIAFRGVRSNQPVAPVTLTNVATVQQDGGSRVPDLDALDTRGPTVPLLLLATLASTTFPSLPGYERVEATPTLALYRALDGLPGGVGVAFPPVEFPPSPVPLPVVVGWLGIVAP